MKGAGTLACLAMSSVPVSNPSISRDLPASMSCSIEVLNTLSLRTVAGRDDKASAALCADAHGFSLHAAVRCGAHQRKELERLCRTITRPALANERVKRDGAGNVVLQLKSAWRDGTM